jgi:hypothetical protein
MYHFIPGFNCNSKVSTTNGEIGTIAYVTVIEGVVVQGIIK